MSRRTVCCKQHYLRGLMSTRTASRSNRFQILVAFTRCLTSRRNRATLPTERSMDLDLDRAGRGYRSVEGDTSLVSIVGSQKNKIKLRSFSLK